MICKVVALLTLLATGILAGFLVAGMATHGLLIAYVGTVVLLQLVLDLARQNARTHGVHRRDRR